MRSLAMLALFTTLAFGCNRAGGLPPLQPYDPNAKSPFQASNTNANTNVNTNQPAAQQVLTSIQVDPEKTTLGLGQMLVFHARGFDQNQLDMPVLGPQWSCPPEAGVISQTGGFTATRNGIWTIMCRSANGVIGTAEVTVNTR